MYQNFHRSKYCSIIVRIDPFWSTLGKNQEVIRSHDRIVESIFFFEDSFETHEQYDIEKKELISDSILIDDDISLEQGENEKAIDRESVDDINTSQSKATTQISTYNNIPLLLNPVADEFPYLSVDSVQKTLSDR